MGTLFNTNYESIIKQAESMLGGLSGVQGSQQGFNAEEFFKLGNMLNGSVSASYNTDGTNTSGQVASKILSGIVSLLNSLGTGEANAANNENKKAQKKASELIKKEEDAKNKLIEQTEQITQQMLDATDIVTSCNGSLSDINKQLEEKQKELSEYVKQLEAERQALENCKPEEREKHLNKILELSGSIAGLTTSVAELQQQVVDLSTDVENSYTTVEELKGNSVEVQEAGATVIQTLAQEGGELIQTNTSMQVKGVTNTATGQAVQNAAQTASTNVFSSGAAVKLYRVANDQSQAGSTRTSGAISNLQTVMQGIGGLTEHSNILANFETAIGDIDKGFNDLFGTWNSNLEPTITSIGSWQVVQESNTQLDATAKNDLSNLEKQKTDEKDNEKEKAENSGLATVNFNMNSLNPFEQEKVKIEE